MDVFSKKKRSEVMSRIRGRNTSPELAVRKKLHSMGYRFRLHQKNLPGKPDIVLKKYMAVIEVKGCFWHQHPGCKRASKPSSNTAYWQAKLQGNVNRDRKNARNLRSMGWSVVTVWECQLIDIEAVAHRIDRFLKNRLAKICK